MQGRVFLHAPDFVLESARLLFFEHYDFCGGANKFTEESYIYLLQLIR